MKPFISASENVRESTYRSIGIGIVFSFFFAIANTYLGLKIGQTVSASIPAAILSMGLSKAFFRGKTTVLEHNIIQTIATMGEGMASGIVFSLPALLLLGDQPPFLKVVLLSLLGGLLGILFMIPMRRFLIVEEHKTLPYPEGTACAEILMMGAKAGRNAIFAVYGFLIAGLYKVLMNAFFVWNEVVSFPLKILPLSRISIDGTPALLGIGYLIGFRTSSLLFAGGLLGWIVIIPLIAVFGVGGSTVYPGSIAISQMSAEDVWSNYVRYIGAGAVGMGGLLHLFKVVPLLTRAFRDGIRELLGGKSLRRTLVRTDQDISMKWLVLGAIFVAILLWAIPYLSFNLVSVVLLIVLSLFFCFGLFDCVRCCRELIKPCFGHADYCAAHYLLDLFSSWLDRKGLSFVCDYFEHCGLREHWTCYEYFSRFKDRISFRIDPLETANGANCGADSSCTCDWIDGWHFEPNVQNRF